jgi:hypothetical protein
VHIRSEFEFVRCEKFNAASEYRTYLDGERRVINLLELRPIMKLVFIPLSLILLEIEIVHTWLPDLVISRATSNNLTFVAVI